MKMLICAGIGIGAAVIEMYINKISLDERPHRIMIKLINMTMGGLITAVLYIW